jgi:hypothetical protein
MMNYELGMHCTGFEFAYCCVFPPYNSILAQVIKTQQSSSGQTAFARLLEGDPSQGLDALGRQTVLRDPDVDANGDFGKYVLEYWQVAQPRETRPQVVPQTSTLISATEGNSLLMWNTLADSAAVNPDGSLMISGQDGNPTWNGVREAMLGDGDFNDPTDDYWNAVWNHLYIYADLEGSNPNNSTAEIDKIRLGVSGHIEYPADCGAGLHPMGPVSHPDEHLTAIGEWLRDNVSRNQAGLAGSDRDNRGIWCTNCHNQLSQEIWKQENMESLIVVTGPTTVRAVSGWALALLKESVLFLFLL